MRSGSRTSAARFGNAEGGYVAVVTVIVASALLLMSALAVDTGTMRTRASELQRIADAAALAGASALPDVTLAQQRADDVAKRNDPTGRSTVVLQPAAGRPGVVEVTATDPSVKTRFIKRTSNIVRTSYAEQSVAIPMGTPYNSIGTGDMLGTVPGNPTGTQGYFLAVSGPCTAKEDGDRYSAKYDGIRGSLAGNAATQNLDGYHCADDGRAGHLWTDGKGENYVGTPASQWRNNVEEKPGGYSYVVDVPCNGGVTPCPPGTPIAQGYYVDVWDPWFLAWPGEAPCAVADRGTKIDPTCVVDKVPIANPGENWVAVWNAINYFQTHFAIYAQNVDGSWPTTPMAPSETFGSYDVKWGIESGNIPMNPALSNGLPCGWDAAKWTSRRGAAFQPFCKDWFPLNDSAHLLNRSGRYRIQVAADPEMPAGGVKFSTTYGYRWDGGRSIGTNTYSLRVRRANESAASWQPCSADAGNPNCATITGDGALSVYVRTPGTADLFLSKMAPAPDYRGRTIQVQLWDPGEGSRRLKILEPVPTSVDASGWKEVPFSWSTSNPGLADSAGTLVVDHAYGWDIGGNRVPIATSASNGLDVSGNYDPASGMTPWPLNERYSQSKFNGRLVTIDIKVPDDYGKDAGGAELAPSQFQDGWWKIRYESNSGVEDRTTWVVSSGSGPVHLARSPS